MSQTNAPTYVDDPSATIPMPLEGPRREDLDTGLRMRELLGEGGMGQVHLAEQCALRRDVAVKSLRPEAPPRARHVLLREAWVTGMLEHPNIVPVHDLWTDDDGRSHLVLKRIDGLEWAEILANPRLLPEQAQKDPFAWHIDVLRQLCNALEMAHARGILHRDLKPANVMIGPFGEVYLLDWGVAIALHEQTNAAIPTPSSSKAIVGTPLYMAPEMFSPPSEHLGPWSDVYLMGAMLYELLSGRPPREGGTLEEMAEASTTLPPMDASWPRDLRQILASCLHPDPRERPSMAELREMLSDHLRNRDLDRVRQRALEGLERLRARLDDSGDSLVEPYRLFGACRFGFEEVLVRAPDDTVARDGLTDATVLMARLELEADNPQGARLLLDQLRQAPEDMRDAVDDAIDAQHAARQRLEGLEEDLDDSKDAGRRGLFTLFLLVTFLGLPFVLRLLGIERGYLWEYIRHGTVAFAILVGTIIFRKTAFSSRLNRGVLAAVAMSPAMGTLLVTNLWLLDAPERMLSPTRAVMDTAIYLFAGLLLDRRALPSALVYAFATVTAAAFHAYTAPILMVGTLFAWGLLLVPWLVQGFRNTRTL